MVALVAIILVELKLAWWLVASFDLAATDAGRGAAISYSSSLGTDQQRKRTKLEKLLLAWE